MRTIRALPFVWLLLFAAPSDASPSRGPLFALPGGLDQDVRDRLCRAPDLDFLGDFGAFSLAAGNARAARRLGLAVRPIGAMPPECTLVVARPEHRPPGRVLFETSEAVLVAVSPSDVRGCCAHSSAIVPLVPMAPSRGFQPPESAIGAGQKSLTPDGRVQALVATVSQANLQNTVQQLASFPTRRSDQPAALQARDWLVQALSAIPGLSVTTFSYDPSLAPNIVAELPGQTPSAPIVVLGAHWDSINHAGATQPAPGADDNASGVAAVLEAARVLSTLQFENTIRFVLFSGEELGLLGSFAEAGALLQSGAHVLAMLNVDMAAYRAAGDTFDVDFVTNNTDAALTQFCIEAAQTYVPSLGVRTGVLTAGTSDHQAFQSNGVPSVFYFEDIDQYSPYLHTTGDTPGQSANDFALAHAITQALVAAAAHLAEPVDISLSHTPLSDTPDTGGPFPLSVTALPADGDPVTGVWVAYRTGTGAFQSRALFPSGTPGEWVGDIPGPLAKGTVDYYLLAQDAAGHLEWHPEALTPGAAFHSFVVGKKTPIYTHHFDGPTDDGWTHGSSGTQDDWQRGAPQGKSLDPAAPFSPPSVWGNDLGQPGWNGAYAPNVDNWLDSPPIDCSGRTGVRLRFRRWLTVEDGFYDQARVELNGAVVWQNPATPGGGSQHLIDSDWTRVDLDVSALADNKPAVTVRFRLTSDGGLQFGGWNVDGFELYELAEGEKRALVADRLYVSASAGSQTTFSIDAGPPFAQRPYALLVSASGSSPPTLVDGTPIPLVFDAVTQLALGQANGPLFPGFLGTLDITGRASGVMALPPLSTPGLVGVELFFAAVTLAPVDWASNPVSVTFAQ